MKWHRLLNNQSVRHRLLTIGGLSVGLVFPLLANASLVAYGTITQVNASTNAIAVNISAASGSPCGSGWFYSLTSDSNDPTMNRLLAAIITSWMSGQTVSLYGDSVTCNQGTNSRFTAITAG